MNQDIAKQWAAELRSGKWEQGRNKLNCGGRVCCLGILSEMAVDAGVAIRRDKDGTIHYGSCGTMESEVLPEAVRQWACMISKTGIIDERSPSLASRNDEGATFSEIADMIEANVDKL